LLEHLRSGCQSLGEFPERSPLYRGDVRRLVVGPHLVFYRLVDADDAVLRRVIILRALPGTMDIDRLVDPDDI
jgi:plasmid stabilization system protein ParE